MKARSLEPEEKELFESALKDRCRDGMYFALWACLYYLGMRISEALPLKIGDVEDQQGRIRTEILTECLKKKTGSVVRVRRRVPEKLKKILRAYLDTIAYQMRFRSGDRLFLCSRARAAQVFKEVAVAAGIDANGVSTHTGRKTFAAVQVGFLIQRGLDPLATLQVLKERLHHADLRSTAKYLPGVCVPEEDLNNTL